MHVTFMCNLCCLQGMLEVGMGTYSPTYFSGGKQGLSNGGKGDPPQSRSTAWTSGHGQVELTYDE